jgi:hypothetical protein
LPCTTKPTLPKPIKGVYGLLRDDGLNRDT